MKKIKITSKSNELKDKFSIFGLDLQNIELSDFEIFSRAVRTYRNMLLTDNTACHRPFQYRSEPRQSQK